MNKRRKKYSIIEVKQIAIEKNGKCLSDTYISNKKKLLFECNVCKHIWQTNFKAVKVQNQWCPNCSGMLNNNIEIAKQIAKERNGLCMSENYINNKTNMQWKCGTCLFIWKARLDRIKSGTWCPKCRRSWGERYISTYLDEIDIKYECEYIISDCKNQRYDFYLQEQKIAIEFDGIQHFQIYRKYTPDQETLEYIHLLDINKTIYSLENHIRLLRISYNDIYRVSEIINTFLNSNIQLLLSDMEKYEYIIDKIPPNITFSVLL